MKKLSIPPGLPVSLFLLLITLTGFAPAPSVPASSDELEGAWKMTMNRDQSMESLGIDMVKILMDGHFMFAFFDEENQKFFSCGGGEYRYEDGRYTEIIRFHTIDPDLIGRSLTFDAKLEGNTWYQSGEINGGELNEVYSRIEAENISGLDGAWHIISQGESEESMKPLKKRQARTWKLIAGSRYSWATFQPKDGELLSCGGGEMSMEDNWCREHIGYDSVDSTMVGKTMAYEGTPSNDEWTVRPPSTRGGEASMTVKWARLD